MSELSKIKKAVFAGGCFWCTEAIFRGLKGVVEVLPGYMGGSVENPTYEQVCTGLTGHAEVIEITYNAEEIDYHLLLEVFFATHDPTSLNRQGNDIGTQYRSEVFFIDEEQRKIAESYIKFLEEEKIYKDVIVTEITACSQFYLAEDYHKNYFNLNGNQPYCSAVVKPKVEKFQKKFHTYIR